MTGFVLSHEMKKGIDPPTPKTQLSTISETGSGAPDRQFVKKSSDRTLRNLSFVTKIVGWGVFVFLTFTPFYEPLTEVVLLTWYLRGCSTE